MSEGVDATVQEEFFRKTFTVFNPAGSVGITVNGQGQVCGISLDEDALTSDEELAREIVEIAGVAYANYQMHLRLFSLAVVTAAGRDPERMDRCYRGLQKLPTPEEYAEMEAAMVARYAR